MDFLRRLFGPDPREPATRDPGEPDPATADATPSEPQLPPAPTGLPCPYCAMLLDPPPARSRLCPRCRQPIVPRRVEGRLVLLTQAAVTVFEAQRQREVDERTWTAARRRWLRLAQEVKAPAARRSKLAAAPISADVVASSRALYLSAAERAVKAARREKHWGEVGHLRREQATALFEESGSPVPLPDEIAALHRDGMVAVLRSLAPLARDVELVSAECCPACRAEAGQTFRITDEIRVGRLPHAGCPKGLCHCDWWPAVVAPGRRRRRRPTPPARPTAAPGVSAMEGELDATPGVSAAEDEPAIE
jgi:hypothetical protein